MGVNVSRGVDNESLMDKLIANGDSLPPNLERAIRLVDRGDYFDKRNSRTYIDLAWRCGTIHLSAPSIYITVLRHLNLSSGLHFLNIGSGSGYLSTIAGLILGYNGINHGIELEVSNIDFANQRLTTFLADSDAPLERDFCIPIFMQGNIFDLVLPRPSFGCSVNSNRPTFDADGNITAPWTPYTFSEEEGDDRDSDRQSSEPDDEGIRMVDHHVEANLSINTAEVNNEEQADSDHAPEEYQVHPHAEIHQPWNDSLPIDPPPLLEWPYFSTDEELDRHQHFQWPTYDRIYVGAAILSVPHLQAILRLLKVGGILVAPLQDELIKITRVSEHQLVRVNLLPVTFSPLILPRAKELATPFYPPPQSRILTLSQLTSRFIRNRLCRLIEHRHGGPPTIGRLLEVKSNSSRNKQLKKRHSGVCHAHSRRYSRTDKAKFSHAEDDDNSMGHCQTTSSDEADTDPDRDCSGAAGETIRPTESPLRHSGLFRILHHMLPYLRGMERTTGNLTPEVAGTEASSEQERVENDNGLSCDLSTDATMMEGSWNTESPHKVDSNHASEVTETISNLHFLQGSRSLNASGQVTSSAPEADTNEVATSKRILQPDELTSGNSAPPHGQDDQTEGIHNLPDPNIPSGSDSDQNRPTEPRHRYLEPNYRYREEIHKIIVHDLHLMEFYVRSVLTF